MSYSIGTWAQVQVQVPRGVVYRWEADGGQNGTGFVLLETATPAVRPCDSNDEVIGDLVLDADSGNVTGDAAGIDRATFTRIAAAILTALLNTGQALETAHTYFG